jgi:Tol biopolymer transport system component
MTKIVISVSLMILFLTACSVEISEATLVSPQNLLVTPTPLATWTPPAQPTGVTAPIATPTSAQPVSWANLHLSGQLVFLNFGEGGLSLVKFDLVSGAVTTLFQPPNKAWLSDASISPDGKQISLAYAPPPTADQTRVGYTSLYLMPADGSSAPAPLFGLPNERESYSNPAWSPDGHYLYYAHFVAQAKPNDPSAYTLERVAYPGGQPEVLLKNAMWPSLSPDGSKLAYLSLDPATFTTEIHVANADGTNPALLMSFADFPVIDAHFFSPDSKTIIFSAVGEGPKPGVSWLERWFGPPTASAHNLPSDWWQVPVAGGPPERLTKLYSTGLNGAFAPDGKHIAFIDLTGVFVMNPDGTQISQLLNIIATGTLAWLP